MSRFLLDTCLIHAPWVLVVAGVIIGGSVLRLVVYSYLVWTSDPI